jgi:hypothetical protein
MKFRRNKVVDLKKQEEEFAKLPAITNNDFATLGITTTLTHSDILDMVAEQRMNEVKAVCEAFKLEYEELFKEREKYETVPINQFKTKLEKVVKKPINERDLRTMFVVESDVPSYKQHLQGRAQNMNAEVFMENIPRMRIGGFPFGMSYNERGWGYREPIPQSPSSAKPFYLSQPILNERSTGFEFYFNEKQIIVPHEDNIVLVMSYFLTNDKTVSSATQVGGLSVETNSLSTLLYFDTVKFSVKDSKEYVGRLRDFNERLKKYKQDIAPSGYINPSALAQKAKNIINRKILQSQAPEVREKIMKLFNLETL